MSKTKDHSLKFQNKFLHYNNQMLVLHRNSSYLKFHMIHLFHKPKLNHLYMDKLLHRQKRQL